MLNSISLCEIMDQYNIDSLKSFAKEVNLKNYSKLKKEELKNLLAKNFFNKDSLTYTLALLDEKEFDAFKLGLNGKIKIPKGIQNEVLHLNEMFLAIGDLKEFAVCEEVATIYKEVDETLVKKLSKKYSWVRDCLIWCNEMYGIYPLGCLLDVVKLNKKVKISIEELEGILKTIPPMFDLFQLEEDYLYSSDKIYKFNCEENMDPNPLLDEQEDKPYYIPTIKEIEDIDFKGYVCLSKQLNKYMEFIRNKFDGEAILANFYAELALIKITSENEIDAGLQFLLDKLELEADDLQKFFDLYQDITNNTRMLVNRGYTPFELHKMINYKGPITLTAGSSDMANMLKEAAPQIKEMGINLDLDSNATNITTGFNYDKASGTLTPTTKKIYPNDPCPCGSGKKYKKCCGKGKA